MINSNPTRAEKISQLGKKCEENRTIVKDITQTAINLGALEKTKPTLLPNGFYSMIYEEKSGKTCYLCDDKEDSPRILMKFWNPITSIQETYSIHKSHLDFPSTE
tara:strand:- start:408 stop:722 length:315 start_codon:yes stop_codon:yes gene_type:complete